MRELGFAAVAVVGIASVTAAMGLLISYWRACHREHVP